MSDEERHAVGVNERKFNGTVTLEITNANSLVEAKAAGEKFWREEYGSSPSRKVAEEKHQLGEGRYVVMIADHSSGSLKSSKTYEF